MTLVVGYAPDERGKAALNLAGLLARSSGDELVVCSVVPAQWAPGPARVDTEYHAYLDDRADQALEEARAALPSDVTATFLRERARSAPSGLLEVAARHDANLLVLGSSSAGAFGHVALGSVTDRLLHSSPVPVALATRGFRCKGEDRVTRVTAAYGGSDAADDLVVAAAGVAARVGASLRLASFAVRPRAAFTSRVGGDAEGAVIRQWVNSIEAYGRESLEQVSELPAVPHALESVVGHGQTWDEAVDDVEWQDGDVLVVGSSAIGPIARVFLGSRATKIIRHSPVPVVVVPKSAAEQLAQRAEDPERAEQPSQN